MNYFFYHVYLDTERDMNDELMEKKNDLILELMKDIKDISENLLNDNISLKLINIFYINIFIKIKIHLHFHYCQNAQVS